jgi:hypothetical protein
MKNIRRIRNKFHSFLAQVNFILTLLFGETSDNRTLYVKAALPQVAPESGADLLKRAAHRFEIKKRGAAR